MYFYEFGHDTIDEGSFFEIVTHERKFSLEEFKAMVREARNDAIQKHQFCATFHIEEYLIGKYGFNKFEPLHSVNYEDELD